MPVRVALPVTINGRIFPREDVDDWTFNAKKGQALTETSARHNSPWSGATARSFVSVERLCTENPHRMGYSSKIPATRAARSVATL